MNYLAELLAFSEWKEVNPLPASAIVLWHELMAVCNKAGWLQEFTVANGLLQAKCGLSRKEFDHARSLLINFGLIKYKKSERVNQAGRYIIVPFVQKGQQKQNQPVDNIPDCSKSTTEGITGGTQQGQRLAHTGDNAGDTLYKRKPKQNLNINNSAREDEAVDNSTCRLCGGKGWYVGKEPFNNGLGERDAVVKCSCRKNSKPVWAEKMAGG